MSTDPQAFANRRARFMKAFLSSKTLDEKLKRFTDAEKCFTERELGVALLNLCMSHYKEGVDYEKTLSFAKRALKIFGNADASGENIVDVRTAIATQMYGLACSKLKMYHESLYYLNTACRMLNKLKGDISHDGYEGVLKMLHDAEYGLFYVEKALNPQSKMAVFHLRNAMEIGEIISKKDRKPLYSGYRKLANEYIGLKDYAEAQHFCFKAWEILIMDQMRNPSEVGDCMRCLACIIQLSKAEKTLDPSIMLQVQADLKRVALESLAQRGDEVSERRAMVMASTGKALLEDNKFANAKRCLKISFEIFNKLERYHSPHLVVNSLIETSEVYEKMDEVETSVMVSRRVLKILEKFPQEENLVKKVTGNIDRLFLHDGQVKEAFPRLADDLVRLKPGKDSKSLELASAYNELGAAYMTLDRPNSAAQVFEYAKDIMDISLGLEHLESLGVWRNLSGAYAAIGSYDQAIKLLEKVIEGLKGHEPIGQETLDETIEFLKQCREKESNES